MYLRTIYSGKGRGIANRGHFLTCERVEEDSKQEQDARMTLGARKIRRLTREPRFFHLVALICWYVQSMY